MRLRSGFATGPLVVLLSALAASGCSSGPSAQTAADELATALAAGDVSTVPVAGDTAQAELKAVIEGVDPATPPTVEVTQVAEEGDRATATLRWTWDLDGSPWTYSSTADLVRAGDAWQTRWRPSIVEPSLSPGEVLRVRGEGAARGDILGAGGAAIVKPRAVVRYGLDKMRVKAGQEADAARRIAQALDLDVADYVKRVRAAGDKAFVEAVVMREAEAQAVDPSYADIPGAASIADELPLAPSKGFAAALLGTVGEATAEIVEKSAGAVKAGDEVGLSGLQLRYDEQLRGTPGLVVEAVTDAEAEPRTLYSVESKPGTDLATTLDPRLQQLAEDVLAGTKPASGLVAIRPSTGDVLAAASGPGSEGYSTSTFGQYAPGSTFKIVSSLALLRAGLTPGSSVSCPSTTVVDGKTFKNYDDYPSSALGDISLREAIANSCNTAVISARSKLGKGDLAGAAAALGLGVDHDLGFPAYFGQVPPPATETEGAADLIGQGKVLASPLAMASVAASVAAGHAVLPRLLPDHDVTQTKPSAPLTPAEAKALRELMRAVVTEGSGSFLADVPGPPVLAKTGTAEFGDATRTHTWMIASQGDLAVAVFVEVGESGSKTAGPLLEAFLRGA